MYLLIPLKPEVPENLMFLMNHLYLMYLKIPEVPDEPLVPA
jgi:hypothetical protein